MHAAPGCELWGRHLGVDNLTVFSVDERRHPVKRKVLESLGVAVRISLAANSENRKDASS